MRGEGIAVPVRRAAEMIKSGVSALLALHHESEEGRQPNRPHRPATEVIGRAMATRDGEQCHSVF